MTIDTSKIDENKDRALAFFLDKTIAFVKRLNVYGDPEYINGPIVERPNEVSFKIKDLKAPDSKPPIIVTFREISRPGTFLIPSKMKVAEGLGA